jgi:histidinol-phosphate/aromatic aminotransferase/cobyric acid decarboxylase-like protein
MLFRENQYAVDLAQLEAALTKDYDLVVLVNPNSPTGHHIPGKELETVIRRATAHTRIWVDETYVEYAGPDHSLEEFACQSENVVVCKSMSKVYALSGARVAYLSAGQHQLEELRAITPPWVVSLPSQVAAVGSASRSGLLRRALFGRFTGPTRDRVPYDSGNTPGTATLSKEPERAG